MIKMEFIWNIVIGVGVVYISEHLVVFCSPIKTNDSTSVDGFRGAEQSVCVCVHKLTSGLVLSDGRRRGIYFDSVVVSPSVYNQLCQCARTAAMILPATRWSTVPWCRVGRDIEPCGLPSLLANLTLEQLLISTSISVQHLKWLS